MNQEMEYCTSLFLLIYSLTVVIQNTWVMRFVENIYGVTVKMIAYHDLQCFIQKAHNGRILRQFCDLLCESHSVYHLRISTLNG